MFDISWTEFLVIGVVALIVIGPKELPAVMRTLGQWTRKLRGMAADFQTQFQEAMREAEMADLKQQVNDLAHDVAQYDPLKSVRDDIEVVGKDIESSLHSAPEHTAVLPTPAAEPVLVPKSTEPPPAGVESVAAAESPASAPAKVSHEKTADLLEPLGAGAVSAPLGSSDEAARTDEAGRTG